jgi:protein-S-isoprenylcysteine O-methyltransferase Ste14
MYRFIAYPGFESPSPARIEKALVNQGLFFRLSHPRYSSFFCAFRPLGLILNCCLMAVSTLAISSRSSTLLIHFA